MMRGQIEPVSALLITGILVGIVGSVYLWGVPLIEKNQDIAKIKNAELFAKELDDKIKSIANQGGRTEMKISIPITVQLKDSYGSSGQEGSDGRKDISIMLSTKGTIYSVGGWIPLNENDCDAAERLLGTRGPDSICVKVRNLGGSYQNEYKLQYAQLSSGISKYRVDLVGDDQSGGEGRNIIISRSGSSNENGVIITQIGIVIA